MLLKINNLFLFFMKQDIPKSVAVVIPFDYLNSNIGYRTVTDSWNKFSSSTVNLKLTEMPDKRILISIGSETEGYAILNPKDIDKENILLMLMKLSSDVEDEARLRLINLTPSVSKQDEKDFSSILNADATKRPDLIKAFNEEKLEQAKQKSQQGKKDILTIADIAEINSLKQVASGLVKIVQDLHKEKTKEGLRKYIKDLSTKTLTRIAASSQLSSVGMNTTYGTDILKQEADVTKEVGVYEDFIEYLTGDSDTYDETKYNPDDHSRVVLKEKLKEGEEAKLATNVQIYAPRHGRRQQNQYISDISSHPYFSSPSAKFYIVRNDKVIGTVHESRSLSVDYPIYDKEGIVNELYDPFFNNIKNSDVSVVENSFLQSHSVGAHIMELNKRVDEAEAERFEELENQFKLLLIKQDSNKSIPEYDSCENIIQQVNKEYDKYIDHYNSAIDKKRSQDQTNALRSQMTLLDKAHQEELEVLKNFDDLWDSMVGKLKKYQAPDSNTLTKQIYHNAKQSPETDQKEREYRIAKRPKKQAIPQQSNISITNLTECKKLIQEQKPSDNKLEESVKTDKTVKHKNLR
jgi:hypothetical protein